MSLVLAGLRPAWAQSSGATLTGTVVDTTGAVLPGVDISLTELDTAAKRHDISGGGGAFIFSTLPPGRYVLRASLKGFTPSELQNITLNVNDRIAVRVELALSTLGEGVTVVAETQRVNTTPAVGTVVDRQFVENLPLNGRSLQSLLELTPGVVLTRVRSDSVEGGQFSVNGQRTNANYLTIDGVSANTGINAPGAGTFPGQSGSGQLPAMTALGGTNGLVSVDALQEFRIQTSGYAPEFGRVPGGQISMVTRGGSNAFHGSAFDYFRHDALDATDWFTNYLGREGAKLRQHDFGGVLGGPIVPSRTFFFGSYEGLRLERPRVLSATVPTLETRATATPDIRLLLDALPLPNGNPLAPGFAQFNASFSDPSRFDSTSVRLDHRASGHLTFFGRFSHAPSYVRSRAGSLSQTSEVNQNNTSVTVGSTWIPSRRLIHDLRVNYTSNGAPFVYRLDDFGGAVPPPASIFNGMNPESSYFGFALTGGGGWRWGIGNNLTQRQLNIVDSITLTSTSHEFKVGVDYRRMNPLFSGGQSGGQIATFALTDLSAGRVSSYLRATEAPYRRAAVFDNFSAYAQDNWRATSRLSLTYGVRWEYVPPPHSTDGPNALTLENLEDPYGGEVGLAPGGTPLWRARYTNFAPRIGGSYVLSQKPGSQFVLKSGFGVFHDLGLGQVSTAFVTYPFRASRTVNGLAYPLSPENTAPLDLEVGPPGQMWVMDRDLRAPYTYQWNVSAERAFGPRQTLTVGYIGAAGRKLLKLDRYPLRMVDWPTVNTQVNVNRNRGYSDYRALQLQFQRRLHAGLQSLVSYTYGHSLDTVSSDVSVNIPAERLPPALDYGDSDYDIRHVLTAALTYQMTGTERGPLVLRSILHDWGVDLMFRARSGAPIDVVTGVPFPPDTLSARPDVLSGQPFWLDDSSVPGGRRLNAQAFTAPPPSTQGNLRRGAVRGFSVSQVDLALRRDIPLIDRARLQLRFELFNLLNTPNFLDPSGILGTVVFGVSTQSLAQGFGGLGASYQIGGPRSAQIAVKVTF